MRRLDPADIPPSGRYDITVTKVGLMGTGEHKMPAMQAVIDGPTHAGKRITSGLAPKYANIRVGDRFNVQIYVDAKAMIDGEWKPVPLGYSITNPRIRYAAGEFRPPTSGEGSEPPPNPRAKFIRSQP